ncbi:PilZ domain-containing protein [Marinobacter caseinilyticus]|uniref:PilZ domain-containing protein n=1 Tax=Marinobacter caseinilyticus TaxID=2692195 RepID=UPI00140C18CB|nr:PilZ domain-containing protein [Marinobacter caseinilyticus]
MNDDDYSFGQDADTLMSPDEQRSEFRLAGRATVVLQLEAQSPESEREGKTLTCYTHDISTSGVRVQTREAISLGALLSMLIKFDDAGEGYSLIGEVVWTKAGEAGDWVVGLKILESDETSFIDWLDAIGKAMSED